MVLGTLLRTGSDGGIADEDAALLVFERGCTLNGVGPANCVQVNAIHLDNAPTAAANPVPFTPGTPSPPPGALPQ